MEHSVIDWDWLKNYRNIYQPIRNRNLFGHFETHETGYVLCRIAVWDVAMLWG